MIDLGHWVHNYSELQKILVFLLDFLGDKFVEHKDFKKQEGSENQVLPLCTSSVLPLHQIKN